MIAILDFQSSWFSSADKYGTQPKRAKLAPQTENAAQKAARQDLLVNPVLNTEIEDIDDSQLRNLSKV